MIPQILSSTTKKKKRIARGKLELLYDILSAVRANTELPINVVCTIARTPDKHTRRLVDSCLDANLLKNNLKENHNGQKTTYLSLTPQGHQFLSHFDKICFISGYKPISERK